MSFSIPKHICMFSVLCIIFVSCTKDDTPQSQQFSRDEAHQTHKSYSATKTSPHSILDQSGERKRTNGSDSSVTDSPDADIWAQLQNVENTHYYVFMRHAIAPGTGDPPYFQLNDCSTQRNLSEEGRDQAMRIGEAFRDNNITVQRILSSEWCRCIETAELIELGAVERFSALNSFFEDRDKGPGQTAKLHEFMMTHQDKFGVTVLVTHFVNISAIAGRGVSSGEMVVMQTNHQDEPEVIDYIEEF